MFTSLRDMFVVQFDDYGPPLDSEEQQHMK